jgi:uncharacterized membrane protein YeiH
LYVGGLAFGIPQEIVLFSAMGVGFALRMLAIRNQWRVPTFDLGDDAKP